MTTSEPTPLLAVSQLNAAYDGSQILRDVTITLPERQLVALMGRNGVGKTTALKCIVGLVKPTSGDISLNGIPLNEMPSEERARAGIGYVPQGRDIFPNLTVWENLKISLVVHGTKANGQVDRVLELFPVLKEMLGRKGGVLSGGQQQQLAIARALVSNPKVLVLDEPTEGIQPSIIDEIVETLQRLRARSGLTMILVEQNLDFIAALSQRILIIQKGTITREVAPGELADASLVGEFVGIVT